MVVHDDVCFQHIKLGGDWIQFDYISYFVKWVESKPPTTNYIVLVSFVRGLGGSFKQLFYFHSDP